MSLANASTLKRFLAEHGLRANKVLGQHFLVSPTVRQRIIAAADLMTADTVLEIGPGLGALTEELARRSGNVIAIEKDRKLREILSQILGACPNVQLVCADILRWLPKHRQTLPPGYKVVADLPYYLTSRFLRLALESPCQAQSLVLLVQREVAERIVAKPPRMNILALAVQYYGKPELLLRIPPGAFWPPPEVTSALLKISVTNPHRSRDKEFFTLIRRGFSSPRKQLLHNLSRHYPRGILLRLFSELGIPEKSRAENLNIEQWRALQERLRDVPS